MVGEDIIQGTFEKDEITFNSTTDTRLNGFRIFYTGDELSQPQTKTLKFSATHGIMDRFSGHLDDALKTEGLLDIEVKRLSDENVKHAERVADLREKIEDYLAQLQTRWSALQASQSHMQNLLGLLDQHNNYSVRRT